MIREEWESVLYEAVPDEVIQDQLNDYVLSLEWKISKLRVLVDYMTPIAWYSASERERDHMRKLGIKVTNLGIEVTNGANKR